MDVEIVVSRPTGQALLFELANAIDRLVAAAACIAVIAEGHCNTDDGRDTDDYSCFHTLWSCVVPPNALDAPAHGTRRLQPERDGRGWCGAWFRPLKVANS